MGLPLTLASGSSAFPVDGSWIPKRAQLRFLLGEIPLFTREFSLLVQETHFTRLLNRPESTAICATDLPAGTQGFLIRSQPMRRALPSLSFFSDFVRYVPAQYERYYIELGSSFAGYLHKFSSKSRNTLHRKIRRFTAFSGGHVDWREYRTVDEMRQYYPLARLVSERTYQERLLNAGFPDDEEYRTEIYDLASRGRARGYLLFHEGKPIAYLFCVLEEADILLYRYLGYDPHYQSWSPGTVLQYLVLDRLFAEREIRLFDFTEGEGPQKRFLSTGSVRCADIYHLRRRPTILMAVLLHCFLQKFSKVFVDVLDRLGLKRRVKKFLRSRTHQHA
jgi:Acetyltransferase (GNAT) domain